MFSRLSSSKAVSSFLLILSIVILISISYYDILGYFFTGLDTLNIIEESRFQSFAELAGQFKKTMTTEFAWYRPMADFFYGLTYMFWGLNPFGYFLTNLLLHITASIALFLLLRKLFQKNILTAWLASVIFAVHPIHVENVPALRMNDIIATVFILFSLMFLLRYIEGGGFNKRLADAVLSLVCGALALFSKEIAVILPVLVFGICWAVYEDNQNGLKGKFIHASVTALPYGVMTAGYLVIRSSVIGGVGGYTSSFGGESEGIINVIRRIPDIIVLYFKDLIYPVDFLRLDSLFAPYQHLGVRGIFILIVIAMIFYVVKLFKQREKWLSVNIQKRSVRFLILISASVFAFALILIFLYPVIAPFVNDVIQSAYKGVGAAFVTQQMDNIGRYPVETYILKVRKILLMPMIAALMISGSLFFVLKNYQRVRNSLTGSMRGMLYTFFVVWLMAPFLIYLITITFDHHDMYISMLPFSTILAMLAIKSYELLVSRQGYIRFISCAVVIVSLIAYSPIFHSYGEWEASGELHRMILAQLADVVPDFPDDAEINIYNFPGGITSFKKMIPHAKEVSYMADFSIEAWLDMKFPGNGMKVVMHGKQDIERLPEDLSLEVQKGDRGKVNINIRYDGAMK